MIITISRERHRNISTLDIGWSKGYRNRRASRSKAARLASNEALRNYVQKHLGGMPDAVSGRLELRNPSHSN